MMTVSKLEWLWKRTCSSALSYPGICLERQDKTMINLSQGSRCSDRTVSPKRESKMLPLGTTCSARMRAPLPPILTSILDVYFNTGTNLPLFVVNEMVSVNNLIVLICALNIADAVIVTQLSYCSHRQHSQAGRQAGTCKLFRAAPITAD
jgi:hypothetical protein